MVCLFWRVCARVELPASNPFPLPTQRDKISQFMCFFPVALLLAGSGGRAAQPASSAFRASETKIPIYYYNPARRVSRGAEKNPFGPGVNAFV